MEYKITFRVPDNSGGRRRDTKFEQRTLGTFQKPYTITGEDITLFRKKILENNDCFPSDFELWRTHKNTGEISRLMVAIHKIGQDKAALACDSKKLEEQIRKETICASQLDGEIAAAQRNVDLCITQISRSTAAIAEQRETIEPQTSQRANKAKVRVKKLADELATLDAIASDADTQEGLSQAIGATFNTLGITTNDDQNRSYAKQAVHTAFADEREMLDNCDRYLRNVHEIYPYVLFTTALRNAGLRTGWLENLKVGEGLIADLNGVPIGSIKSAARQCSVISQEQMTEIIKSINQAIDQFNKTANRMKANIGKSKRVLNSQAPQNVKRAVASGLVGAEYNQELFGDCLACTKDVRNILLDISNARKVYLRAVADYLDGMERLSGLMADKERLEKKRKELENPQRLSPQLDAISARILELNLLESEARDALLKIESYERSKTRHMEAHIANSPKKDARSILVDDGKAIRRLRWEALATEQQRADEEQRRAVERRKVAIMQQFVDYHMQYFQKELANIPPPIQAQFAATFKLLAEEYVKNGGILSAKILGGLYSKRIRVEGTRGKSEYNLVRFSVTSENFYRIMISFKSSSLPVVLFAGHKEQSDPWLNSNTAGFIRAYSDAQSDGHINSFGILAPLLAQKPTGNGNGNGKNGNAKSSSGGRS